MKKESFNKKLSIKKSTISNLDKNDLKDVKGGVMHTEWCTRVDGDCWTGQSRMFQVCIPQDFLEIN